MRAGTDSKVHIRNRHFQPRKEDAREVRVVMLAGMYERLPHSFLHPQRMEHGRSLHETWTSPNHMQNVHSSTISWPGGFFGKTLRSGRIWFMSLPVPGDPLWGTIVEHQRGWRSQYAYPQSLLLTLELRGISRTAPLVPGQSKQVLHPRVAARDWGLSVNSDVP